MLLMAIKEPNKWQAISWFYWRARAFRAELALNEIRDEQGRVCRVFELCHAKGCDDVHEGVCDYGDHDACASSVAAWMIADKALNGREGE